MAPMITNHNSQLQEEHDADKHRLYQGSDPEKHGLRLGEEREKMESQEKGDAGHYRNRQHPVLYKAYDLVHMT